MGRTLRTNSSSGGAPSSSAEGLTLDDISTAFDAPRLLQTKDITTSQGTPSDPIKFTSLDTTTYSHFRLRIDHMGGNNDAMWITMGPMYGSTQANPSHWSQGYWRSGNSGTSAESSGRHYLANSYDLMYGQSYEWSALFMNIDFYWCDPSTPATAVNHTVCGSVEKGITYNYPQRALIEHWEWRGNTNHSAHPDGIWIAAQNGFNKHQSGSGAYPMRMTLYGNKRRAAAA
jgi:hypothetical protein